MTQNTQKVKAPYDNLAEHDKLCDFLKELYEQKNNAYGDSFHRTYQELGIIAAITRISDKYHRIVTLGCNMDKGTIKVGDESIRDTLIDLANYALMTVMEIDRTEK